MHTTLLLLRDQRIRTLTLCLALLGGVVLSAQGQVAVQVDYGQITIANANHQPQLAFQATGKNTKAGGWFVTDNVGNTYTAGGYQSGGGGGDDDDGDVIIVGGYQSGGGGDDDDDGDVIIIGGYQDALNHFREFYGALIEHDEILGVDLITLPGAADPYATFFNAILSDTLHGHRLVEFFRLIELASLGVFGTPSYEPAIPSGLPYSFPNDLYYKNQWNLEKTRLHKAQWHPGTPQQTVRMGVIDSGVGAGQRGHQGLDGLLVHHEPVAPTTGYPLAHGLGLVSLLADRNDDASGITGLLGAWNTDGCYANAALTTARPPEIYSYNVGDFGPSSVQVARAIRRAIDQDVDIINLSLRLAYSPSVEQAIQDALAQNIIVVAAAGNYAPGDANKPATFPANIAGVIAVGAAGQNRNFTTTSATSGVDLLAPGEDVLVGAPFNIWYEAAGTSFAAPHVAAALALMRTVQPGLTPADALAALQQGATFHGDNGVGFLDAAGAFNHVTPPGQQVDWDAMPAPHECGSGAAKAGSLDAPDVPTGTFAALPETPALEGNYPNPFNPETSIRFLLPTRQHARLSVYNALGQQVAVLADGVLPAGQHDVRFAALGLPSGTYFARLETEATALVRSMVLTK